MRWMSKAVTTGVVAVVAALGQSPVEGQVGRAPAAEAEAREAMAVARMGLAQAAPANCSPVLAPVM